ncbi:MAG TPA: peptidase C45 [Caulifigura sp.]|nr:peptidase C45 [Caulifigura sp.]
MSTLRLSSLWLLTFALVLRGSVCNACTTAVISGKATADGRPILWKNRDISTTKNEVAYINDGKYAVMAQVNAGARKSIWMGVNSAGLCIENSLCKDLTGPEGSRGPGNGEFMLKALQECATVDEVEKLLEETNKSGRTTNGSFGVIDAGGGAVLFEAAPHKYVKFDANNPKDAPEGIIVRSNFSCTGQGFECPPPADKLGAIYSAERYKRAAAILLPEAGRVDVKSLLRVCARDLSDAGGNPHPGSVNGAAGDLPEFVHTKNTISRTTTVSWAVFHGVKAGENPLLTTMWIGLGDPKFSAAVPCWVATADVAAELVSKDKDGAPICIAVNELRARFYDKDQDGVRTEGLPKIWRTLWPLEDELVERTAAKLTTWRETGVDPQSMRAIHVSAAEQVLANLNGLLKLLPAAKPVAVPAAAQ